MFSSHVTYIFFNFVKWERHNKNRMSLEAGLAVLGQAEMALVRLCRENREIISGCQLFLGLFAWGPEKAPECMLELPRQMTASGKDQCC